MAPDCEKQVDSWTIRSVTSKEMDVVFQEMFDLIHDARCSGDTSDLVQVFECVSRTPSMTEAAVDLPLSLLRLTFTMREHVESPWRHLLEVTGQELQRRGKPVDRLLWGLDWPAEDESVTAM